MVWLSTTAYLLSMEDIGRRLGSRLREIRRALGVTQDDFALRSKSDPEGGVSQGTVSNLERGKGWDAVKRICRAIEASGGDPLDLFEFERPPLSQVAVQIRDLAVVVDDETQALVLQILQREVRRQAPREPEQSSPAAAG